MGPRTGISNMVIKLLGFQGGYTKLERFLPKDQHIKRKSLNFAYWFSGEVSQIRRQTKVFKHYKISAPKLIFFHENKMRKIPMIFDIEN